MLKIAPSILAADFFDLGDEIRSVSSADLLHIDVMDGTFVPNISVGLPVVRAIRKHTDMPLDVHLMVTKPARYVEDFAEAGADIVSFHLEADWPVHITQALEVMERCGVKKAIALRPITSPEAILPYLERLDMVLVMTVEPGFGGQKLMESQIPAIARMRELIDRYNPACDLEVDGGIYPDTAKLVTGAGANVLVAGSAIFKQADRASAIRALRG